MPTFTQDNRVMKIETPLGKDVLILTGFSGTEAISSLFRYELEMVSDKNDIKFEDIIGKGVTVSLMLHNGDWRYFNGIISSFRQTRGAGSADKNLHLAQYRAIMVPSFWILSRTTDSRIFQNMKPLEIIDKILTEKKVTNYRIDEKEPHIKREYCVQYNETDLNFISRLMEHEGIFYFFEHEDGKHTMVIADSAIAHKPCPGQERAQCQISSGKLREKDYITGLERTVDIRPDKYSMADFNFKMPATDLKVENDTKIPLGPPGRELYDYPGYYENRKDGDTIANIRMQEEEAMITIISGSSRCRAFTTGYRFELEDHYREDMNKKEYIITAIRHEAKEDVGAGGETVDAKYENLFSCIPHEGTYRPQRKTPKPRIYGTQTAIVAGPKGEEIYTDEHGRVKVQFHWDREGKRDEKSSCWIRVGQIWSGQGWGAVWIPRIGHEVIVSFVDGDPDRPLVTGSVYNGANTPPYPLPDEKTKSTIKSNSSKGGGGFNELRFEDKKGSEEIFLHGQKDWTITILNDKNQTIGHDETLAVGNNRTKTVGVDQSETIGSNKTIKVGVNHTETIGVNMALTVGSNKTETVTINSAETIGVAKELTIGGVYQVSVGGAMNETVGAIKAEEIGLHKAVIVGGNSSENIGNNMSVSIGKDLSEQVSGKHTEVVTKEYSLKAKKVTVEAEDEITLKTGSASIVMKKNGDISIQGAKINVKGSGNIVMKGSKILQN